MLLALVAARGAMLLPDLEASLTLFFFCGLITLSFTRLGILRQVRTVNGKQADPTRAWLGALTLFSCLLIALVFLLEAMFSYPSFLGIVHLLQPLWDGLGTLAGWLLYAFIFLVLTPLFAVLSWVIAWFRTLGNGGKQPTPLPVSPFVHLTNGKSPPTQLPPELLSIGRWVVLGAVGLLLLVLVQASLRRWFLPYDAQQLEETREQLDRLPQQRRPKTQRKKQGTRLSGTPASARAHYRLLLQTIAAARPALTHQPAETPLEYEQRLRVQIDTLSVTQEDRQDADQAELAEQSEQPDAVILHALTQEYMEERYGQQQPDPQQQSYLRQWMPRLLKTLTGK